MLVDSRSAVCQQPIEPPLARDAFQLVLAGVGVPEAGADREILDCLRHEHLARRRTCRHACADRDGDAADLRVDELDFACVPLTGTVTIVMAEGRRMMRLAGDLSREHFGALISEYQRLLSRVFRETGGGAVEVAGASVAAGFATAKEAAVAATAAQRAVATHEWPYGVNAAISIGVHSGQAGIGSLGPAIRRCAELCDAAEGGQVFLSQATASLLEDENLGEIVIRDLGEHEMRRTRGTVRAYELALPSNRETAT